MKDEGWKTEDRSQRSEERCARMLECGLGSGKKLGAKMGVHSLGKLAPNWSESCKSSWDKYLCVESSAPRGWGGWRASPKQHEIRKNPARRRFRRPRRI